MWAGVRVFRASAWLLRGVDEAFDAGDLGGRGNEVSGHGFDGSDKLRSVP